MNEELKKAREALKKIKWETDSCIKHEITGEYMLIYDVRSKECDTISRVLDALEKALTQDKTLEAVKKCKREIQRRLPLANGFSRKQYQLLIDWFDDIIQASLNEAPIEGLDDIIREVEGK